MKEARLSNSAEAVFPAEKGSGRYLSSLRYALYVITHPFDGFWDLNREKKGSMAAAHTILALFLITYVMKLMYTNFQFIMVPVQYINVYERIISLALIFLVLCLANWALTTLFDGKGRFKDIYMGLCYALTPYVLIQLPCILLSHLLAYDEAEFYSVLISFSEIWCAFLAFIALMEIHDFGPAKTLIFIIATVVGALVIIFLVMVLLSLISDAYSFFVSLYKEIRFRLY
ncbi:MAG: YIP1 family protein [Clostridiales bacterium]|nr:YIP1 family protein [Clostridiales bacterium]